jgi:hypothetical protein
VKQKPAEVVVRIARLARDSMVVLVLQNSFRTNVCLDHIKEGFEFHLSSTFPVRRLHPWIQYNSVWHKKSSFIPSPNQSGVLWFHLIRRESAIHSLSISRTFRTP